MTPVQPDWAEHATTIVIIFGTFIGVLLSVIGVLLIRALNSNSTSLKNLRDDLKSLFGRVEQTEKAVAYLQGQHEARTRMTATCTVDK